VHLWNYDLGNANQKFLLVPTVASTVLPVACDDGNACTSNDLSYNGCTCGGILDDSDGDGLCNSDDCAPNDFNLPNVPGMACDDLDPATYDDKVSMDGCSCTGILNNCIGNEPNFICQYSTDNWVSVSNSCNVVVCEGEELKFNFLGCDSDYILNMTGPNGFDKNSINSCGEILVSNSIASAMAGTYTAVLANLISGCTTTKTVIIAVQSIGMACDDGNSATSNDVINQNCVCAGTAPNPCDAIAPINICQYSTNGTNYIDGCTINVCEGENLIYTFSGCNSNYSLNVTGPNGFNQTSTDACGSIFISNSVTSNMSGIYTSTLTDLTTGCSSVEYPNITVASSSSLECAVCVPNGACDDGDNCTAYDAWDINCDCVGIFQDSDSNGVCDAEQCPIQIIDVFNNNQTLDKSAIDFISLNGRVSNATNIDFTAGQYIEIIGNFEAEAGADLHIYISSCQ